MSWSAGGNGGRARSGCERSDRGPGPAAGPAVRRFQREAGATDGRQGELARPGAALVKRRHGLAPVAGRHLAVRRAEFELHELFRFGEGGRRDGRAYVRRQCRRPAGRRAEEPRSSGVGLRHATAAAISAAEERLRNCRREFDMFSPNAIV